MLRFALLGLALVGCTDDNMLSENTGALKMGQQITDRAEAGTDRAFPLMISASTDRPFSFDVVATALDEGSVKVQVYGPENDGDRVLLIEAGTAQPRGNIEVSASTKVDGEHLIVVGSYRLETDTTFELGVYCERC